MNYFITYDIEKDSLRTQIAKTLERHGCERVQKSVFFAILSYKMYASLYQDLGYYAEEFGEGDNILFVPLDQDQLRQVVLLGENKAWAKAKSPPKNIVF